MLTSPNEIPPVERVLEAKVSLANGVEVPIPMFPLAKIVKNEEPVDDATLNGLRLEVEVACTLKA